MLWGRPHCVPSSPESALIIKPGRSEKSACALALPIARGVDVVCGVQWCMLHGLHS